MKFDASTGIGLIVAILLVVYAAGSNSNGAMDFSAFVDLRAVFIVVFGTIFLTIASFNFRQFYYSKDSIFRAMFYRQQSPNKVANDMLTLCAKAQKGDILLIDGSPIIKRSGDFFKKGISMLIDGLNEEHVVSTQKDELQAFYDKNHESQDVLQKAAEIAPAMGLIGTLIGLVQMLGNLSDPTNIGPAMAVALLTTLYGAILAYLIFLPLANKIERNTNEEVKILEMYLNTIIAISQKQGPVRLETRLNAILSKSDKVRRYYT